MLIREHSRYGTACIVLVLNLTVLRAASEQVDDVEVSPNKLHHLHLLHEICYVALRGIGCRGKHTADV